MSDCEVMKADVDDEMLCRLAGDLIYNYSLSVLPSLPRWLSTNLVSMSWVEPQTPPVCLTYLPDWSWRLYLKTIVY